MAGVGGDGETAAENEAQPFGAGARDDVMVNAPLIVGDQIVRPCSAFRLPHMPHMDEARERASVRDRTPAEPYKRRGAVMKQQLPLGALDLARRLVRIRRRLAAGLLAEIDEPERIPRGPADERRHRDAPPAIRAASPCSAGKSACRPTRRNQYAALPASGSCRCMMACQ